MNFDEAISAHAAWKTRLRSMLNGQGDVDPKVAGVDNACPLGKWLYGEGAKYASHPAYATVKSSHQALHQLAGSVATKVKAGQKPAASAILDSPAWAQASLAVVAAIGQLRKSVKS